MSRRRNDDRMTSPLKAQIIAGADGTPAFVVLPIEGFFALLTLAHKGSAAADDREADRLALTARLFEEPFAKWGADEPSKIPFRKMLLADDRLEATFKDVGAWLRLFDDEPNHPVDVYDDDVAAYDAAVARNEESFPREVAERLIAGESPLRVFREYRGLTQKELAERASTVAAYISQIETARRTGSAKLLRRLADALGVEVDDVI